MYKWILVGVVGMAVATCVVVIKFGLKPKPVPIIKASNFEEPVRLGLYISRQLYQKLKNSSPIVIGLNKENAYESKVVETLIEIISKEKSELKETIPEFILLKSEESFSNSPVSKQDEIKQRYGDKLLAFTIVNLKGVAEAPQILNCEEDHRYNVWLECIKSQKVRQMKRARKVNIEKTIAIVENQSQKDIMIYIRE